METVVWNMNHRVGSWKALADLHADVALLSEARVPEEGLDISVQGGDQTAGRNGYPRRWATAIVSPLELRRIEDARASRHGNPLALPSGTSRPGAWEAAVIVRPDKEDVTVISLYGLLDEKSDASVRWSFFPRDRSSGARSTARRPSWEATLVRCTPGETRVDPDREAEW